MQISTAQWQRLTQTAANEELLVGIKTKVDALTVAPPPAKITEAQNQHAQAAFKLQLGKRLTQEWLQLNGVAGITEETVVALLQDFTGALQEAGSEVSSAILAPPTPKPQTTSDKPKPTTLGEKKRLLGEGADGSWGDEAMNACDDGL